MPTTAPHDARKPHAPGGFTLVELLVVIGIIALLISILLPALNTARKSAQNVKCLANLRTMGQAMEIYAASYNNAILGAAVTSGCGIYDSGFNNAVYTATTVPPGMAIYPSDYFAPILQITKGTWTAKNDPSALNRYVDYMTMPALQCPTYAGVLAVSYPSGGPTVQSISYVTAMAFLMTQGAPYAGVTSLTRMSTGTAWPIMPGGYYPRVTKVGQSTIKIFAADGAKFSRVAAPPDYAFVIPAPSGTYATTTYSSIGNFTDLGAYSSVTSAYDRSAFPNAKPGGATGYDPRPAAFRHGTLKQLRLNAVFYDGHAESMDELTACDPARWLPSKCKIQDHTKLWTDVQNKYGFTTDNLTVR
jgi:prepilin-type N-terminal cleavage/methylation domain-containing protein